MIGAPPPARLIPKGKLGISIWVEILLDLPLGAKKVLLSLRKHWESLCVFADHPQVPMDNNEAERALREPVVGRKKFYGSGSAWSGQLAA